MQGWPHNMGGGLNGCERLVKALRADQRRRFLLKVAAAEDQQFKRRWKKQSLDVLLKYMPEVEAMRFLDDVVDVSHLERKLKQKFPGDDNKLVEEVRLYESVCVCIWG